jgi:hypothetical protein
MSKRVAAEAKRTSSTGQSLVASSVVAGHGSIVCCEPLAPVAVAIQGMNHRSRIAVTFKSKASFHSVLVCLACMQPSLTIDAFHKSKPNAKSMKVTKKVANEDELERRTRNKRRGTSD